MKVAIHQPNFLPWLGLFHRIALVDTFVFFDHVQAMGGRSWLSRNQLLIGGQAAWLTVPVRKSGRLGQRVDEVQIDYSTDFAHKHLRTLELNYGKTPFFEAVFPAIRKLYDARYETIAEMNMAFIRLVCEWLRLPAMFVRSSEMTASHPRLGTLTGNELVLETCRACNAATYISGTGCLDFIRPEEFERAGVRFLFQEFNHPVYSQARSRAFIPNLSVVDALFNVGPGEARNLIADKN